MLTMAATPLSSSSPSSPYLLGLPPQPCAALSSLQIWPPRRQRHRQQQQQRRSSRVPLPRPPGAGVWAAAVPGAGGRNWSPDAPANAVDLCIFPMWTMPMPTSSGSLNVFEPQLVALLEVVQHVAASSLGQVPARFGAMPYDWVQRQNLADDAEAHASTSDLALPGRGELSAQEQDVVGCACQIDAALAELEGDSYWVQYHALRRFKPQRLLRRKPFLVVRGVWLDDNKHQAPVEGITAEELEQQLWAMIQEVVDYSARLQGKAPHAAHCCGGAHAALPEPVCKFSPLAPPRPTTAEERVRSWSTNPQRRMPAEVAVWRNMKSAAAVAPKPAPAVAEPVSQDPYWAACERLSKSVRQEAFSFAAASIVELGPAQRTELLSMTDTGQRLRWLMQAIEPHLGKLRAECSMRQAMGDL